MCAGGILDALVSCRPAASRTCSIVRDFDYLIAVGAMYSGRHACVAGSRPSTEASLETSLPFHSWPANEQIREVPEEVPVSS